MTEEMEFFVYLLECYAVYKNETTGAVFKRWEEHNLLQVIYDNYWLYHTERIENAFEDIDSLIATGKSAWA
ncbi:MAG: DUF3791 domain-containing protein [Oscillospiraceae bacterium]|nr:DUF3791 domain-containing protein [Oscillospiraceae bacterium]